MYLKSARKASCRVKYLKKKYPKVPTFKLTFNTEREQLLFKKKKQQTGLPVS